MAWFSSLLLVFVLSGNIFGAFIGTPNSPIPATAQLQQAPVSAGVTCNDNFTDTDSTLLENHTSDSGHAWTFTVVSNFQITSGKVNMVNVGVERGYYIGCTPTDADYSVQAVIAAESSGKTTVGPTVRMAGTDSYFVRWASQWELYKSVGGSETGLGVAYTGDDPSVAAKTVKLEAIGSDIAVYIGGISRITASDSDITAKGNPGLQDYFGDTGALTNLDNYLLND